MQSQFTEACAHGNLPEVKSLLQAHPEIDITADWGKPIREVCKNGHLEVFDFLFDELKKKPDVNIEELLFGLPEVSPFIMAGNNKHWDLVRRLLEIRQKGGYGSMRGIFIFSHLCGFLEAAKMALEMHPGIDAPEDVQKSFFYACNGNHLECAKWLKEKYPAIQISRNNFEVFKSSCEQTCFDTVGMLLESTPRPDNTVIKQEMVKAHKAGKTEFVRFLEEKSGIEMPSTYFAFKSLHK